MENVNWVILRFRSRRCAQFFLGPRTSDFRPGSKPKKQLYHSFFYIFFGRFLYIWPLARPNIAEKGAAIVGKALGRVREAPGRVCKDLGRVWKAANFGNAGFRRLKAPETCISGAGRHPGLSSRDQVGC